MLTIGIKSATTIIGKSKADVAKIDCEGAEINLTDVPKETLRLIQSYLIETHSIDIQKMITKKFLESNFRESRAPEHLEGEIYMVYFEKN